ncbi:MAG: EAL domain-containing protein, partial [Pseudomonadota bacterium]
VPDFSVGHATALHNPCVDSVDVLEHLMEMSAEVAKVQLRRIRDRERELMQTIVQSKEILYPNFQAVFNLQEITKELAEEVNTTQSIASIKKSLYGFESLIRVRKDKVDERLALDHLVYMDAKLLRPDILFGMAAHSKVALELDQLCMGLGIAGAVDLPGKLMVNILPRNLMHIERLTHLLTPRGNLVFEISESEGVTNPALMQKVRDYVSKIKCSIAADDFGKGHASIERVINLRPELIKIDRSLLEKIHLDGAKRIFVEGIIKAAKLVNATVLAEGIETWAEAEVVQKMGIDLIQGFLLHRPQPLEQIVAQITDNDEIVAVDSVA